MTRTAVVTGGGTGIGRAVAGALAKAGLDVVITGRRAEVLDEAVAELGETVRAVAFDAARPEEIDAALPALPERVDVLVNNAGGNATRTSPAAGGPRRRAPAVAHEPGGQRPDRGADDRGAAAPVRRGRAGDQHRFDRRQPWTGQLRRAKAALIAWNVDLARRVGERGGTANVVAPGVVLDTGFFGGAIPDERLAALVGQTFTGRAGEPDDVAAVVGFLASAQARHVTGQVMHVNGGAYLGR